MSKEIDGLVVKLLSHPAVPDFALPDLPLFWIIFGDLFRLHRNTPHCPGFCIFPDRMEI